MVSMLDFSIESYKHLLISLIASGYSLVTVEQYLSRQDELKEQKVAIIRHDIDRRLSKALVFADLESQMGITATYYFRYPGLSHPEVISSVSSKGHEVGYHYEVMSRAQGEPISARILFQEDLQKIRDISPVHTVCMHGAPLSGYDNLSLWDHFSLDEFDLLGEAFLSVTGVEYYSDTGRTWSPEHKIRDKLPGDCKRPSFENLTRTDDLIQYISQYQPKKIYIVSHPERWAETRMEWIFLYGIDLLFNLGKSIISWIRGSLP